MAIVSRSSVEWAKSIKKALKQSPTQRTRQTAGISDNSGSNSESDDSENETRLTGTGASKHKHREDTTSDGSVDQGVTMRGNPTLEDGPDGDHGDSKASGSDVAKCRFRLRRKKDGKWRCRTRLGKGAKREDVEMGDVS